MSDVENTRTTREGASALARMPTLSAIEVVLFGDGGTASTLTTEDLRGIEGEGSIARIGPLPVAPQRWLWLGIDAHEVTRAVAGRAHVVDVDGKYALFTCEGPLARKALSAVVDVDRVLEPRACAALTLFDCPAVLLRAGDDRYAVCVHSSYAASFEAGFGAALDATSRTARRAPDGAARMSDNSDRTG